MVIRMRTGTCMFDLSISRMPSMINQGLNQRRFKILHRFHSTKEVQDEMIGREFLKLVLVLILF